MNLLHVLHSLLGRGTIALVVLLKGFELLGGGAGGEGQHGAVNTGVTLDTELGADLLSGGHGHKAGSTGVQTAEHGSDVALADLRGDGTTGAGAEAARVERGERVTEETRKQGVGPSVLFAVHVTQVVSDNFLRTGNVKGHDLSE